MDVVSSLLEAPYIQDIYNNESDKGSGISTGNNHHNLPRGRCEERYPIVWMTLERVGTRRGTPEGLVPVVLEWDVS